MELVKIGEKTYYIKNNTNIGVYKVSDNEVYLIDTGNDKEAAKKIVKLIENQEWNIVGIISTHSNADHIGGNNYIQTKFNCPIYAYNIESCISEYPVLESSFLYGGYPFKELKNKFLLAKESKVTKIDNNIPEGLDYFELKGHFFDMIGIKTSDDVYFLADSLFNEETIKKYHLIFIYDVEQFLETLNILSNLKGKYFIPSHCEITNDISYLINLNRQKIEEIINKIYEICQNELSFEEILKQIFDEYNLQMNPNQYVLIGSTIRSYLSYMYNQDKLKYEFKNNRMLWSRN